MHRLRVGEAGSTATMRPGHLFFFFFFFFFFSPAYFIVYRGGQMVILHYNRKSYIFPRNQSQRGPTFSRGVPTFFQWGRWVEMLFSIETHITCDFPVGGGGPDPLSPL